MPKQRSPNRDKAKEIYLSHNGKIKLSNIAAMLGESEGTIRGWKAKDKWDDYLNGTLQSNLSERSEKHSDKNKERSNKNRKRSSPTEKISSSSISKNTDIKKVTSPTDSNSKSITKTNTNTKPRTKGGQSENKNAVGNKGGTGGPIGNKKAVVTHEFEKILFADDMLNETEKALLDAHYDKFEQHLTLIKTLRIQEYRAMIDIATLKSTPSGMVVESVTKNKGTLNIKNTYKNRSGEEKPGDSSTETTDNTSHVATPVGLRIMRIEDALIRIRCRIQKAIEVWHKMEMDAERLGIERQRLELYRQKLAGQFDLDGLIDGDDLGLDSGE